MLRWSAAEVARVGSGDGLRQGFGDSGEALDRGRTGSEVADVIGGLIGGDVPAAQRRSRAAELLGLSEAMVDAALAYYAEFTDEIDAALAERARAAEVAEAAWARGQALLET